MAGTPTNTTANTNKWSTRQLVTMALMTAIGVLLSFIEFPLLPGVTWLKFDASNMPAMVAGFAYGPGGGVAVGILTAILHGLLMADFSGAVMNIIVVLFYVLPAALIYKRMHTFAGAIIALVVGTLLAVVGAVLGNLVITPIYTGWPVSEVAAIIVPALLPFNLIKFVIHGVVTFLVYKPISNLLNR